MTGEPQLIPDKFPCLVWASGMKGPEPEIWYHQVTRDLKPVKVLQFHALNETHLTAYTGKLTLLQFLADLYPLVIACPTVSVSSAENVKPVDDKPIDGNLGS